MLYHGVLGANAVGHAKAVDSIALEHAFQGLLIARLACKLNIVSVIVSNAEVICYNFSFQMI